jgi:transposase InsO family protein
MAEENATWGAPRIHAELLKLGFRVSERTVSRYMPKREASPDAIERWKRFLRNHREGIAAMDLFTVPTASFRLLYMFFVIHHSRRQILHVNVTTNPGSDWIVQQLREAFPYDETPRFLIFDRDATLSRSVIASVKGMGIEPCRIAFRSPWQNGTAERWIGSARREMLDHVVILSERQLLRLLREYIAYHHDDRPHLGLGKETPSKRAVSSKPSGTARIVSLPRLGGLHHRYEWREAA